MTNDENEPRTSETEQQQTGSRAGAEVTKPRPELPDPMIYRTKRRAPATDGGETADDD